MAVYIFIDITLSIEKSFYVFHLLIFILMKTYDNLNILVKTSYTI